MRISFRFDGPAWAEPRTRWTISTIAPLLDAPWGLDPPDHTPRADQPVVWIGQQAPAPRDTAAVIAFEGWREWQAATLERVKFDGVALAAPAGASKADSPGHFPSAWLQSLWHVLSRQEEREDARRDQWQCYSGEYTRLGGIGLLETPWVNLAAEQLRSRIEAWCASRGVSLPRTPRWKNGARFAVALSHDVDDVRLRSVAQSLRLLSLSRSPKSYAFRGGLAALSRSLLASSGSDPYSQFERWAQQEADRGFGATWFVFGQTRLAHEYDAPYLLSDRLSFEGRTTSVGQMFGSLGARGFEIGLHGTYGSWRDAGVLRAERERVARATGREVTSTRQHYLRFDIDRTLAAQEGAGLTTDATLGYNEAIGFRAGIAAPFHPWNAGALQAHRLLEVPLTLMDGALFRSFQLSPEAAVRRTLEHLESVERVGGLAGLLWHPNAAAERLFPGWWSCFVAALDHLVARGAWVANVGEIAEWWRERNRRLELDSATD